MTDAIPPDCRRPHGDLDRSLGIDVDAIERLPEGSEARPSTDALLGAATDWLDGLTVDEFLGRLRD